MAASRAPPPAGEPKPTSSSKKRLVVAFDIETTGPNLPVCLEPDTGPKDRPKDALISIGWTGGILGENRNLQILAGPDRIDIDLEKPADTSWKDFWAEKKWSRKTYDQFWAHHLRTLDSMQQKTHSLATATHLLNFELTHLEETYEITPIVDSVYDVVWIDTLLGSQGYNGLEYSRIGNPTRVIETYSFRLGRASLDHRDAATGHENGSAAAREAFARQREGFSEEYEHPHVPDRDAKGILAAYFGSLTQSAQSAARLDASPY